MSGDISAHDAWNAIAHLKALTRSERRHVGPTTLVDTNLLSIALTLAEGAAAAEARGYARGRAEAIAALRDDERLSPFVGAWREREREAPRITFASTRVVLAAFLDSITPEAEQ